MSRTQQSGRGSRARESLLAGERAARYIWLEEALRGRRVLEIGTEDTQSLSRLFAAGARQVVGTTPDPARLAVRHSRTPSTEWVVMDSGRADFPDASFDVALVVDLARELDAQPRFLEELSRVLSPEGFALLTVTGRGAGLGMLFGSAPKADIHPERFVRECARVFQPVRVLAQIPFVGVGIQPVDRAFDDLELSWEPSFAGSPSEPSHLNILAGSLAPAMTERALVELPYADLCTAAEAQEFGLEREQARLTRALENAWSAVSARDAVLAKVAERLPRLRSAIASRIGVFEAENDDSDVVAPTVLERPMPDEDSVTRLTELSEALEHSEAARESAERRANELAQESHLMERMLQARVAEQVAVEARSETGSERESADLVTVLAEESGPPHPTHWGSGPWRLSEVYEAEAEIAELKRELAEQRGVVETLRSERDDTVRRLEAQLQSARERIAEHDHGQHALLERLGALEQAAGEALGLREQAVAERDELMRTLDAERKAQTHTRKQNEQLEFELHARTRDLEGLRTALRARDEALEAFRSSHAARAADRRAVELAASHLSREVEGLRARTKALRNERDTLATASRMLADERDAALALAKRGVSLERDLHAAQANHEVVEQRAEEAESRCTRVEQQVEDLERRLMETEEARRALASECTALQKKVEKQEAAVHHERGRRAGLDQDMARFQIAAAEATQAERAADDRSRALEVHLMEAVREAREARADAERARQALADKHDEVFARNQDLLELASARARERGSSVRLQAEVVELRGREALAKAQVATLQRDLMLARSERSEGSSAKAESERVVRDAEQALARTRDEVAVLRRRGKALERDLGQARAALEQRNRREADAEREELRTMLDATRARRLTEVEAARQQRMVALSDADARTVQALRLERARDRLGALEAEGLWLRRALAEALVAADEARRGERARRRVEFESREADRSGRADTAPAELRGPAGNGPEWSGRAADLWEALEAAHRARQLAEQARRDARVRVLELEAELAVRPPQTAVVASRPKAKAGTEGPDTADAHTPPNERASPHPTDVAEVRGSSRGAEPRGFAREAPGPFGERRSASGSIGVRRRAEESVVDLEQARAEVGQRLARIREREEGLIRAQKALEEARAEVEALAHRRASSAQIEEVRRQLERREREVARLGAAQKTLEAERHRLRELVETAQEGRLQRDQRIAELETALMERSRRLDFLSKELADKTIRLRRLSGLAK